ncbi:glycoside hydrolase family 2 protein [Echinicola soli]|uniref:Glycoside hydrolase family 2 protein n=1 Tax=Echinicola soli TaxID=2591634 RepID=A0A514CH87_9BACT|nr:glycoside hydrolase family 2 TIM barrel-domain containing protein [Echinicola soli]QDH79176.1 glycoside hydrolase family 2 protein [Echinicola soli]
MFRSLLTILIGVTLFIAIVLPGLSQEFLADRSHRKLKNWQFVKADLSQEPEKNWRLFEWEEVKVPHTWNDKDVLTEGLKSYHGVGTYEHRLKVGDQDKGKRHFIRFEGVSLYAEVYVNRQLVGKHRGGYSAFCVEVTDQLQYGKENLLVVKVDNVPSIDMAPPSEQLFPLYGGIYRPVTYFTTPNVCVSPMDYASSGVYVQQQDVNESRASLQVEALVSAGKQLNPGKYDLEVSFYDASGNEVGKTKESLSIEGEGQNSSRLSLDIENPRLWNGKKDPYLYTCSVVVLHNGQRIDEVREKIGLRYFEVDEKKGFMLNGSSYPLYGVCRHQEIAGYGPALSPEQHERDVELINELGATTVRLAHYQQSDYLYDLLSQSGIVIWAEIPNTPTYQAENRLFMESCEQQLKELIKQNYNKAGIFTWGMYNETRVTQKDLQVLHSLAKSLDPGRLTVFADNIRPADVHQVTDLAAWNLYFGWYGKAGDWSGYEKWARNAWESKGVKMAISEYGAGGSISQQAEYFEKPDPTGQFFPEQYQAFYHENVWKNIKDLDFIWGKYIWNMFDFSWTKVNRGDRAFINHKGLITHDREVKKDAFYFYKANWSDEPVLHIANRRLVDREHQNTSVKVYSNLDKVVLYLNGKKVSSQKVESDIQVITWDGIRLSEGENTIDVIGYKGKEQFVDQCTWNFN